MTYIPSIPFSLVLVLASFFSGFSSGLVGAGAGILLIIFWKVSENVIGVDMGDGDIAESSRRLLAISSILSLSQYPFSFMEIYRSPKPMYRIDLFIYTFFGINVLTWVGSYLATAVNAEGLLIALGISLMCISIWQFIHQSVLNRVVDDQIVTKKEEEQLLLELQAETTHNIDLIMTHLDPTHPIDPSTSQKSPELAYTSAQPRTDRENNDQDELIDPMKPGLPRTSSYDGNDNTDSPKTNTKSTSRNFSAKQPNSQHNHSLDSPINPVTSLVSEQFLAEKGVGGFKMTKNHLFSPFTSVARLETGSNFLGNRRNRSTVADHTTNGDIEVVDMGFNYSSAEHPQYSTITTTNQTSSYQRQVDFSPTHANCSPNYLDSPHNREEEKNDSFRRDALLHKQTIAAFNQIPPTAPVTPYDEIPPETASFFPPKENSSDILKEKKNHLAEVEKNNLQLTDYTASHTSQAHGETSSREDDLSPEDEYYLGLPWHGKAMYKVKHEWVSMLLGFTMGCVSGLLGGLWGINTPPLSLYFTYLGLTGTTIRDTLLTIYFANLPCLLLSRIIFSIYRAEEWFIYLIAAPITIAGLKLGFFLHTKVPNQRFILTCLQVAILLSGLPLLKPFGISPDITVKSILSLCAYIFCFILLGLFVVWRKKRNKGLRSNVKIQYQHHLEAAFNEQQQIAQTDPIIAADAPQVSFISTVPFAHRESNLSFQTKTRRQLEQEVAANEGIHRVNASSPALENGDVSLFIKHSGRESGVADDPTAPTQFTTTLSNLNAIPMQLNAITTLQASRSNIQLLQLKPHSISNKPILLHDSSNISKNDLNNTITSQELKHSISMILQSSSTKFNSLLLQHYGQQQQQSHPLTMPQSSPPHHLFSSPAPSPTSLSLVAGTPKGLNTPGTGSQPEKMSKTLGNFQSQTQIQNGDPNDLSTGSTNAQGKNMLSTPRLAYTNSTTQQSPGFSTSSSPHTQARLITVLPLQSQLASSPLNVSNSNNNSQQQPPSIQIAQPVLTLQLSNATRNNQSTTPLNSPSSVVGYPNPSPSMVHHAQIHKISSNSPAFQPTTTIQQLPLQLPPNTPSIPSHLDSAAPLSTSPTHSHSGQLHAAKVLRPQTSSNPVGGSRRRNNNLTSANGNASDSIGTHNESQNPNMFINSSLPSSLPSLPLPTIFSPDHISAQHQHAPHAQIHNTNSTDQSKITTFQYNFDPKNALQSPTLIQNPDNLEVSPINPHLHLIFGNQNVHSNHLDQPRPNNIETVTQAPNDFGLLFSPTASAVLTVPQSLSTDSSNDPELHRIKAILDGQSDQNGDSLFSPAQPRQIVVSKPPTDRSTQNPQDHNGDDIMDLL